MKSTVVIIGAGHCGLAMSLEMMKKGIEHVILECGVPGSSWRNERWDSLKLLTPNRMNALPGMPCESSDPNGFMSANELIDRFDSLLSKFSFPVQTGTTVLSVEPTRQGYRVQTDQRSYHAKVVVMATGACNKPRIPGFAQSLPSDLVQTSPLTYKRPSDLPEGKTLVVGASASGLQLARELQFAGHQVTLAVGNHTRMPRYYRGRDIFEWIQKIGVTSTLYSEVPDIERVRRLPSPSLVADDTLDLNTLQDLGVELVGRCIKLENGRAMFSGSLANICASADLKMTRLIAAIEALPDESLIDNCPDASSLPLPTRLPDNPRLKINLALEGFKSIVWATGFTPDFSWLNAPHFDNNGQLLHDGGVVAKGLYVMGLPYLRYRLSTFIFGACDDAKYLAGHIQKSIAGSAAA